MGREGGGEKTMALEFWGEERNGKNTILQTFKEVEGMETEVLGKTIIHTTQHKTSLLKTWLYLVNSLQNCTKFITPQQNAHIPGEKGNSTEQQRESLPAEVITDKSA